MKWVSLGRNQDVGIPSGDSGDSVFLCLFQLSDVTCTVLVCGLFLHFERSSLCFCHFITFLTLPRMPHCSYKARVTTPDTTGWSRMDSHLQILDLTTPAVSGDIPRFWRLGHGHLCGHYPAHHRGGSGDGGERWIKDTSRRPGPRGVWVWVVGESLPLPRAPMVAPVCGCLMFPVVSSSLDTGTGKAGRQVSQG